MSCKYVAETTFEEARLTWGSNLVLPESWSEDLNTGACVDVTLTASPQ